MKFPVLWQSFVSELAKVIYLAWDLGSRSYITLHFCAKVLEQKKPSKDQTNLSQIVAVCLFQEENGETSAVFVLEDNEITRKMWNNSFKLLYKVTVGNNLLNTTMTIENKGNV